MQDPWTELALFDWVLACGSTSLASFVLRTPQSSVSRRFRAFCLHHRLDVRRIGGRYRLFGIYDYVHAMRQLAQSYRLRAASASWAVSEELNLGDPHQLGLPGQAFVLPEPLWGCVQDYCQLGMIDLVYIPGHLDPLDGLPFVSAPVLPTSGLELDGLLSFRRRLHHGLENLSAPSVASSHAY